MVPGPEAKSSSEIRNPTLFIISYPKAFDYVDHNKLWKILKEMGIQTT